jgi:hypothetical protein
MDKELLEKASSRIHALDIRSMLKVDDFFRHLLLEIKALIKKCESERRFVRIAIDSFMSLSWPVSPNQPGKMVRFDPILTKSLAFSLFYP